MGIFAKFKRLFSPDPTKRAAEQVAIMQGLIAMRQAGRFRAIYTPGPQIIKLESNLPEAPLTGIMSEITWRKAAQLVAEFEAEREQVGKL